MDKWYLSDELMIKIFMGIVLLAGLSFLGLIVVMVLLG